MTGWWRRNRLAALLAVAVVAALTAAVLLTGSGPRGVLDPDAYDPDGAHALEVLLEQQGVVVTRVVDVPAVSDAATTATTVFVPLPSLLSEDELRVLGSLPGGLVVAEAGQEQLAALAVPAQVVGLDETRDRDPSCPDEVATNAGRALTGGFAYRLAGSTGCYPAGGGATLVRTDRVTLLGAADALTNGHLGEEGNAALAVGLLAQRTQVLWLVPSPTRAELGERPVRSPEELLPDGVRAARWQLLVAGLVLAVWRARRLGRVVLERLPVVVRASETVEGHGRLYHASGARETAAEALREAARRTLSRLAHGGTVTPEVLIDLVVARSTRDPSAVRALLYGPTPTDDAALVRLARSLDALVHEALTREGAGT